MLISSIFPFSDLPGSSISHINRNRMNSLAKSKRPIDTLQLDKILNQHLLFLEHGGAGGTWLTVVINGIVTGIYNGPQVGRGKQAQLEHNHFGSSCTLKKRSLPFSNCCGIYAPELQCQHVNLSHSLLTDTDLSCANFKNAQLKKVDFSRSVLTGVDFRGADLRYADFEHCDLRTANFRGANLHGARFPGVKLEGVLV